MTRPKTGATSLKILKFFGKSARFGQFLNFYKALTEKHFGVMTDTCWANFTLHNTLKNCPFTLKSALAHLTREHGSRIITVPPDPDLLICRSPLGACCTLYLFYLTNMRRANASGVN